MPDDNGQKGMKIRPIRSGRFEGHAHPADALLTDRFEDLLAAEETGRHYVFATPHNENAGAADLIRPVLEPEARALVVQYDEYSAIPLTVEEHRAEILTGKKFFVFPLGNPHRRGRNMTDSSTGETWFDDTPRTWVPTGQPVEFTAPVPVIGEEDPHVAFFLAANDLREYISHATKSLAKEVADLEYEGMATVTIVHTPICAIPLPDQGMELFVSIEHYAVEEKGILNPEDAVSRNGSVPIKAPNNIELKQLMMLEEDLIERGIVRDAYKDRPYLEQRIRELNRRKYVID